MPYRIKDWDKIYENNRTRELKRLEWVPVPNRMDGLGYTELVDHPNGAAHFGAWIAIVEIASRQEIRGVLPSVRGNTAIALARISRLPVQLFAEVLQRLAAPEIDWIEVTAQESAPIPQDPAVIPHDTAYLRGHALAEGKGREGNGREEKHSCASGEAPVPVALPKISKMRSDFEEFWKEASWSSRSREDAWQAYRKRRREGVPHELLAEQAKIQAPLLLREAEQQRRTAIYVSTWLNKGCYLDDVTEIRTLSIAVGARGSPSRASPEGAEYMRQLLNGEVEMEEIAR